jgi:hypothetical protein
MLNVLLGLLMETTRALLNLYQTCTRVFRDKPCLPYRLKPVHSMTDDILLIVVILSVRVACITPQHPALSITTFSTKAVSIRGFIVVLLSVIMLTVVDPFRCVNCTSNALFDLYHTHPSP